MATIYSFVNIKLLQKSLEIANVNDSINVKAINEKDIKKEEKSKCQKMAGTFGQLVSELSLFLFLFFLRELYFILF